MAQMLYEMQQREKDKEEEEKRRAEEEPSGEEVFHSLPSVIFSFALPSTFSFTLFFFE